MISHDALAKSWTGITSPFLKLAVCSSSTSGSGGGGGGDSDSKNIAAAAMETRNNMGFSGI